MLIQPNLQIVSDAKRYHKIKHIERLVIHRIKIGARASDIVAAFAGGVPDAAAATGHKMPYHCIVEADGTVVQCVPYDRQAPHALVWNPRTIAIGLVGDFRYDEPPPPQWFAAARLCRSLEMTFKAAVYGHDELPDGSVDKTKQCPGPKWGIPEFLGTMRHLAITGGDIVDFENHSAMTI